MRALTILNPWAHLIASGEKCLENRTWRPPRSVSGHRIAIHAGKRWSPAEALIPKASDAPLKTDCTFGAIVATAVIDGFVTSAQDAERAIAGQGAWFLGPFAWVLRDMRVLRPIACVGQQGIWRVPDNLLI